MIIAGALLLGVAAGALSYLDSSLVIEPAWRANIEELRERGATIYFKSCAGFAEPRFWPECIGSADEKRARGAKKLVEFCTGKDRYVRFFGPEDCLSEDRPPLALVGSPGGDDVVTGGVVAAGTLVVLLIVAFLSKLLVPSAKPPVNHEAAAIGHRAQGGH